jgi:hypothetical protein
MLTEVGVRTLVDVRRFPSLRRNPQFKLPLLETALREAGIEYRHALELGGRLEDEPGAERFGCIRLPAFRSYAARMGTERWQTALSELLAQRAPCFMCGVAMGQSAAEEGRPAESPWRGLRAWPRARPLRALRRGTRPHALARRAHAPLLVSRHWALCDQLRDSRGLHPLRRLLTHRPGAQEQARRRWRGLRQAVEGAREQYRAAAEMLGIETLPPESRQAQELEQAESAVAAFQDEADAPIGLADVLTPVGGRAEFEKLPVPERRRVLRQIVERVVLKPGRAHVSERLTIEFADGSVYPTPFNPALVPPVALTAVA